MAVVTSNINALNLETIKDLAQTLIDMSEDERIDETVRGEYKQRLGNIMRGTKQYESQVTEAQAYGNDCPNGKCDV